MSLISMFNSGIKCGEIVLPAYILRQTFDLFSTRRTPKGVIKQSRVYPAKSF
jgi:hypothetical protein